MLLPGTATGAHGHNMAPGCVPLLRFSVRIAPALKYQRLQETAWTFQLFFLAPYQKDTEKKCINVLKTSNLYGGERPLLYKKRRMS